jgi:hypothetical protein
MASFPGFIQLQAALVDAPLARQHATWRSSRMKTWRACATLVAPRRNPAQCVPWGVPPQDVIDRAVALRKRLDDQRDHDLDPFKTKMVLVVGKASPPTAMRSATRVSSISMRRRQAMPRGTQRAARRAHVADRCEHGNCRRRRTRSRPTSNCWPTATRLLTPIADAAPTRGDGGGRQSVAAGLLRRPSRPPNALDLLSPEGTQSAAGSASPGTALKVSVINGDLMFVRQPSCWDITRPGA